MTELMFNAISNLKQAILNDKDVIVLNKIEKEMINDKDVILLSIKKEKANDDYNFALSHFKVESQEVKKAQKEFYEAKKNLDSNTLVKKYLEYYKKVRELYDGVNSILFSFIGVECEKRCI